MANLGPKRIFIANLPYDVTENVLLEDFHQFGEIEHCQLVKQPGAEKSRGFGFIIYQNSSGAFEATSLNKSKYRGRQITVEIARQQFTKNEYIQQGIGSNSRPCSSQSSESPAREVTNAPYLQLDHHLATMDQHSTLPQLNSFENLNNTITFPMLPMVDNYYPTSYFIPVNNANQMFSPGQAFLPFVGNLELWNQKQHFS